MCDTNGRISFIDMLPTRTGRAERIHAQIGRVDVDVDCFIRFRVNKHAGKGSMPAVSGIERGLPHQAVHAGFSAKVTIGIFAGYLEICALDTRNFSPATLPLFLRYSHGVRNSANTCVAAWLPNPVPRCRQSRTVCPQNNYWGPAGSKTSGGIPYPPRFSPDVQYHARCFAE